MTTDERLRLSIHTKFTELLGSEEADALITHIVPVPWHDVATKDDLRLVRADIRVDVRHMIIGQTRWMIGDISAMSAVVLTIARLAF